MRVPIFSRKTKRGAYWYCYVRTASGQRLQRALHIRDDGSKESERAAIAAYWQEQARATNGQLDQPKRARTTLAKALAALAAAQAVAELSDGRQRTVYRAGKHLIDFFGVNGELDDLSTADMVSYATKAKLTRKPITVRQELGVLSLAMAAVGLAPPKKPKLGNLKPKPQEPLTGDELRRFFLALKPKYKLLGLTLVCLGIRTSEYNKITEIDWQKRMVWVDGTKTQRSKRWVPVPDELWELMVSMRATGWHMFAPLHLRLIDHVVRSTCKRAGIGPRSVNDLRGTYSTQLSLQGVSAAERAALQGNSELMQVATYAQPHLRPDELRGSVDKLPRITRQKPCITGGATPEASEVNTACSKPLETSK